LGHLLDLLNLPNDFFADSSLYAGLVLTWYCYFIINQGGYKYRIRPDITIYGVLAYSALERLIYYNIFLYPYYEYVFNGAKYAIQFIIVVVRIYFNLITFLELRNLKSIRYANAGSINSSFIANDEHKYRANELISGFILVFTVSDLFTLIPLQIYWVSINIFNVIPWFLFPMAEFGNLLKAIVHLNIIYNHRMIILKKRLAETANQPQNDIDIQEELTESMGHVDNQVFFTGFNISNSGETQFDCNFSAGVRDFLDDDFEDIEPLETGLFASFGDGIVSNFAGIEIGYSSNEINDCI
jgi:hypothetical protein